MEAIPSTQKSSPARLLRSLLTVLAALYLLTLVGFGGFTLVQFATNEDEAAMADIPVAELTAEQLKQASEKAQIARLQGSQTLGVAAKSSE